MKTYVVWIGLMGKRIAKKPAFLLFLLLLPLMSFMVDRLGQGESRGVEIGILPEGREQEFMTRLQEQEGLLRFRLYEDEEAMCRDVERGRLDCGVLLHAELWDGLSTGEWQETITVYTTRSSSMTEIVKEKIASVVFTLYAEMNYVDYIEHSEAFAKAEETDVETDIVAFARAAYEQHLLDGSTFAFRYHGNAGDVLKPDGDGGYGEEEALRASVSPSFRLRGILAVCIFVSGLCGLLTDWKDREEKRFRRLIPAGVTTMVNVWMPTVYTSEAALLSLWLTGNIAVPGGEGPAALLCGLGKETAGLIFYQFLIVLYCSIISIVLRKQEAIAAAVPLLTLLNIICCPVWIRLALYVPLFRVLEKLFPATWYLLL